MAGFDAVFVGSGINSLAGARAAREGRLARLRARAERLARRRDQDRRRPDGAAASRHEVFSSWHPLWVGSPAYAELKPDLDRLGLEYLNTDLPTGDGVPGRLERAPLHRRRRQRRRARRGVAAPVRRVHGRRRRSRSACSAPSSGRARALALGRKAYRQFGRRGLVEFAGHSLLSARDWLTDTFDDERAHGLLAPWVLHTGLGPDQAMSGFMTQVIACALQLGGMPVPKGGGVEPRRRAGGDRPRRRAASCAPRPRSSGSSSRTGRRPRSGWRTARRSRPRGPCWPASRRRSSTAGCSARATRRRTCASAARRFRYGRGEMQIHIAMNELPRWRGDERLARTPLLHLTPGLDGVSRAVNEADRGLLPAEATIALGQPMTRRPVARAGRLLGALGAAAGAAAEAEGRRRGRDRRRRRHLDGGAARGVRRPDRRADRPPHRESRARDDRARRHVARPTWRRRTRTGSAATSTPARARSTRTCSSAPPPRRRGTRRRSSGSGTSARARIPAPASAPAPATSSRSS